VQGKFFKKELLEMLGEQSSSSDCVGCECYEKCCDKSRNNFQFCKRLRIFFRKKI